MPESRHTLLSPEQIHLLGHDEHTPAHVHGRGHIVYPSTGVLSMVTEDGSWIAPPNRAVWIPAGFTHQHRAHGTTDMRIVFMSPDMAGLLPERPAVLALTALAREAVLALTETSGRSTESRDRLRRIIIDDVIAAPEQPLHLPEPHDDRLLAVTHLVERDLASPVSLASLGRRVGASERTLSRLFQRETGMSFRQWRIQLRIHRSLLMLTEGVSVVDTATACGWSNPSAFIDAFDSLVGQTPGKYQHSLG
ncbi:AraC family transcriptional regulator [Rothia uropygialis]|uniref:AraC family transcriptional regulator n=1 Tax=Kocuria sp. 36 TaxID=1415402 RepID=UPI00101D06F4|nr:helix-turn-helix transcriptional regulator [Kocuria sp. 36]